MLSTALNADTPYADTSTTPTTTHTESGQNTAPSDSYAIACYKRSDYMNNLIAHFDIAPQDLNDALTVHTNNDGLPACTRTHGVTSDWAATDRTPVDCQACLATAIQWPITGETPHD